MLTPFGASLRPLIHTALALCALAFFLVAAPQAAHATGTPYYVSPSGNDNNPGTQAAPFLTIQQGINASINGDTVLIADGTYSGLGNRDIDFNGNNITVTSQHGETSTTIDCGGTSSVSHRGFYLHSGETSAVISGLTIENGYESNDVGGGNIQLQHGHNYPKLYS